MTKYIKCPECNGKGEVPCSLEYGTRQHPDNCPSCGGDRSARFTCHECNGRGKVEED